MTETKRCACCGEEKPVGSFHKNKTSKDGLFSYCKVCTNKRNSQWKKNNPSKVSLSNKDWRAKNPEKSKAIRKAWRDKNISYVLAHAADYREQNKEKLTEGQKAYYLSNKDKYYERAAKRRLEVRQATPSWADVSDMRCFYEAAFAFKLLTGQQYEVDHIVPISSKKVCGLHVSSNLRVVAEKENRKKGNRYWPDMP